MWFIFAILVTVWLAILALPVWAAVLVYDGEWWSATRVAALWLLSITLHRRLRLGRFIEVPPSLL
jgi:hypothetical protein